MYTITYNEYGQPTNIKRDNCTIPFDELNMDFIDFLVWNNKQDVPLDWKKAKDITPITYPPSLEERLKAVEDKVKTK